MLFIFMSLFLRWAAKPGFLSASEAEPAEGSYKAPREGGGWRGRPEQSNLMERIIGLECSPGVMRLVSIGTPEDQEEQPSPPGLRAGPAGEQVGQVWAPASPEPCGAGELTGVQPWLREGWNPPPQCAGESLVGWRHAGHALPSSTRRDLRGGALLAARGSARGAGDETERGLPATVRFARPRPSSLLDRPLQNRLTCRWPWWRLAAWQPAQNDGTCPRALSAHWTHPA